MPYIDQETVNRILEAANIVEVVSDFVKLKRRGVNYVGLCPFHNDRSPSFYVSPARGLCKCFSCGKGASAVGFIMEHEQMSYVEALKYLAKKYNIEVKERELTDAEKQAESERESMLAVNQFALSQFEHNLTEDPDGIAIGLSYFRERGISDVAIQRFHLGYSLDKRDALFQAAKKAGFNEKYLVETGLCIRSDNGSVYDRFKGRVIYPVFGISGKVVAFGGRTLLSDKKIAKYVNSPESLIYSKSKELYGLYQAKSAIVKKNKCILVEGYMDVISMSQSGIENVVASSGTALTEGQIRMIHRFTDNVTVIYDSDAAGIKASLRGIDMLLSEGMKIKVLLLPDGEDPDSFAQSHTLEEVEKYIVENETDFIRFKTRILLEGAMDDPIKRSSVITDIVKSIACIPDNIARTVYIGECSRLLAIDEKVLKLEVDKAAARRQEEIYNKNRDAANIPSSNIDDVRLEAGSIVTPSTTPQSTATGQGIGNTVSPAYKLLKSCEQELLRYIVKYGMVSFCEGLDQDGNTTFMPVIAYVSEELKQDAIEWSDASHAAVFNAALDLYYNSWSKDLDRFTRQLTEQYDTNWQQGLQEIQASATNMADIKKREIILKEKCDKIYNSDLNAFVEDYIELHLASSPDAVVRSLTTDLASERHHLSKVHTKYTKVETERDRLMDLVPKAIAAIKDAILSIMILEATEKLAHLDSSAADYGDQLATCMKSIDEYARLRMQLARNLGERVIVPRR